MRDHRLILAILAGLMILTTSSIYGQIVYGQPASGSLRMIYSNWSIGQSAGSIDISQLMFPVGGFFPLQDNLEMRFFAANASNRVDIGDEEYTLSGMSDIRLQLNGSMSDDRILLSMGINLPTGKKKLSHEEEQLVMAVLTQNYVSFPIRRLGEGLGINFLAGTAMSSGNSRLGGTIMYQFNGSYEAYEDEGDYKPGNMLSISANADTRSDKLVLLGDITLSSFSTDKLRDKKFFKQGDQLGIHAGIIYGENSYTLEGDLNYLIRGRNESYSEDEVIDYRLKVYGNEFSMTGKFAYHYQEIWYVAPVFELRLIAGDEFEGECHFGSANNIGFGMEYGRTLNKDYEFGVGFKYYTGKADDGDIDLTGYRLSASIGAAF